MKTFVKPDSIGLAAGILLATPLGYPFITEGISGPYKLPGGRWKEKDGTALSESAQRIEVARNIVCRELFEEVGILLTPGRLEFVGKEDRKGKHGKHEYFLFKAVASKEEVEERRERVESRIHRHFLSKDQLLRQQNRIVKPHVEMLQKFNLWPL